MSGKNTLECDGLYSINILVLKFDAIIETDDDEVHKALMAKATLRFGKRGTYTYLINGKFIQVNTVNANE